MGKIEWTETTWNPTTGCTRAAAGCDNCYAVTMTKRLAAMGQEKYQGLIGNGHFNGVLQTHESELLKPLRWKKPRKVFVNSMSDLFHKAVPFEFIDKVFAVMALCPQHTFQVLTKRPERMAEYFHDRLEGHNNSLTNMANWKTWCCEMADWACDADLREWHEDDDGELSNDSVFDELTAALTNGFLPNVWLGTSVENQDAADQRVPHLLRCRAAVRFLSCEPLIGSVDLTEVREPWMTEANALNSLNGYLYGGGGGKDDPRYRYRKGGHPSIDWVIVGGESGPNARPCNIEWIRSIVRQCADASVPCFVKQLGTIPETTRQSVDAVEWPIGTKFNTHNRTIGREWTALLKDKKGGDPDEWPADIRVREFPNPVHAT